MKKTNKNELGKNMLIIFEEEFKKKYGITVEELIKEKLKNEEKEIKGKESESTSLMVPLGIFSCGIEAASCLAKYLHENKKMRFSEIAKVLNRDERTIWKNYNNSLSKKEIVIKEEGKMIPVVIFSDRRISIFESLVKYFRENNHKNKEISQMLGKDERNIATFYFRAIQKTQ